MNVVVGDETGLIKVITMKDNKVLRKMGAQAQGRAVDYMRWASTDLETEVVAGLRSGVVEWWDVSTGVLKATFGDATKIKPLIGLDVITTLEQQRCISCDTAGVVALWDMNKKNTKPTSWSLGDELQRMRLEPTAQQSFATGGKERLLKVWDIETQKETWKARNVPHDFLELRVPVWVNDLAFDAQASNRIATGTAHHHVRLYDTKVKQQAVMSLEVGEFTVSRVVFTPDSNAIVYSDGRGRMRQIDLRTRKVIGGFKGSGGCVKDINYHQELPFLATCSLDRYLRVYHSGTRKVVNKVYLKQRQLSCLFSKALPVSEVEKKKQEEAKDAEELWKELDIQAQKRKKKEIDAQKKKRQKREKKDSDASSSEDEDEDEDDESEEEDETALVSSSEDDESIGEEEDEAELAAISGSDISSDDDEDEDEDSDSSD